MGEALTDLTAGLSTSLAPSLEASWWTRSGDVVGGVDYLYSGPETAVAVSSQAQPRGEPCCHLDPSAGGALKAAATAASLGPPTSAKWSVPRVNEPGTTIVVSICVLDLTDKSGLIAMRRDETTRLGAAPGRLAGRRSFSAPEQATSWRSARTGPLRPVGPTRE